ncbi:C4-dicarboxylate ABC transporter, partial [Acidobacteriota bacterium]
MSVEFILLAMVVSYVIAKSLKISTEISMFIAAVVGGLAGGAGIPARHIVEGAFTYFDIILIFITATIFMNILKESGGIAFVVRGIIKKFYRRKSI